MLCGQVTPITSWWRSPGRGVGAGVGEAGGDLGVRRSQPAVGGGELGASIVGLRRTVRTDPALAFS
jgi:hypothetical protein